ncbi:hypothetical protein CHUAL_001825 [Chamberlinius hualienensis]
MCNVLHHGSQHLPLDQDDVRSEHNAINEVQVTNQPVMRCRRHHLRQRFHQHYQRHHHHHHYHLSMAIPSLALNRCTRSASSDNNFQQSSLITFKLRQEQNTNMLSEINWFLDTKENEIMRDRCEDCVTSDVSSKFTDSHLRIYKSQSTLLHVACALPRGASWVKVLCGKGAKVNARNQHGQTPLHIVLLGDPRTDHDNMAACLECLLQCGADVNAQDDEGDTPLHYLRTFLKRGLYNEAAEVAHVLLQCGANPNAINRQSRTLLTYSVSYLDDSIALSRLLLNSGALVWRQKSSVDLDADQASSFNWFLKSVIQMRRLENCFLTLKLLSQVMGEAPNRMHSHVLRIMFKHVRCFRVLGPVFLQLKLCMLRYWAEPQDLKYLCSKTLRKSLGPQRLNWTATAQLGLPKPLQKYVLFME